MSGVSITGTIAGGIVGAAVAADLSAHLFQRAPITGVRSAMPSVSFVAISIGVILTVGGTGNLFCWAANRLYRGQAACCTATDGLPALATGLALITVASS